MKRGVRSVVEAALALFSLSFSLWPDDMRFSWRHPEFGVYTDDQFSVIEVHEGSSGLAAGIRVGDKIDRSSLSFAGLEFLFGDRHPRLGSG
jgi:hypothetical protein